MRLLLLLITMIFGVIMYRINESMTCNTIEKMTVTDDGEPLGEIFANTPTTGSTTPPPTQSSTPPTPTPTPTPTPATTSGQYVTININDKADNKLLLSIKYLNDEEKTNKLGKEIEKLLTKVYTESITTLDNNFVVQMA